ncbi:DUF1905 domain-containing protein [Fulvivirga sp. RKSG066]|uniref:DUF1905 domain-containing protein n=1 Tax=Fulvivirga aurantia TaxID=2529383 RepID=UPI0012BC1254|nr:DUF1905 domain-containing protein [Fulvivirga aurantia]MTI20549.1 DUF1905 domain-containing protein [Fulvivirga aurantia]
MTFKTTLEKFESNVWGFHLPVAEQYAEPFVEGDDKRVKCVINEELTLHCALMPRNNEYFILMNKKNIDKLGLAIGQTVDVQLEKDTSEYGMPMPDSFRMLLDQDEEGNDYFHKLTPGKQRTLIYIVGKVKNIDSQLNKGLAILYHLTSRQGKLDFKILNETIKEYNQRSKLK